MKKIIAANWKMNHGFDETDLWLDGFFKNFSAKYEQLREVEMVLCPPAILLDYIDSELVDDSFQHLEEVMKHEQRKIDDFSAEELNEIIQQQRLIRLGGQDCHHELSGSFTGDVSAAMLRKVGCEYVIIGHCERRGGHFESNEIIGKKIKTSLSQNLIPIICLGESKEIRARGQHLEFIAKQLLGSIPAEVNFQKMVIAYEPIWSIGTGLTPTAAEIEQVSEFIAEIFHKEFSNRAEEFYLLYGGSVNAQNSREILAIKGVDGLLVGKASLDVEEFIQICISSSAFG
jgi:triosephosphate isomerase